MDAAALALAALAPLALLQLAEFGVGVYNARRVTRIQSQADRAEAKLDELIGALKAPEAGVLRGGHDPRAMVEAREERADAAARVEMEILAQAVESFGERWGPAIIEWVRVNAPGPWKRALKNPAMTRSILEPAFALAQRQLSKSSAPGSSGVPDGYRPAGYE